LKVANHNAIRDESWFVNIRHSLGW